MSILIAFALDAWWGRLAGDALTRQHLRALIAELDQVRADLKLEIQGTERTLAGTLTIVSAMSSPSGRALAPPSEAAGIFELSTNVGAYLARDAVLTAMMESGELMDLSNDSIFPMLGDWQTRIERLEMDSGHLERNREETILNRMMDVGLPLIGLYSWSTNEVGDGVRISPAAWESFLSDQGLQTAFAMRADRTRRLIADYRTAYERAAVLVRLLSAELDAG